MQRSRKSADLPVRLTTRRRRTLFFIEHLQYFFKIALVFWKIGDILSRVVRQQTSAFVAQSVEQVTLNHWVHGSSPCERTIFFAFKRSDLALPERALRRSILQSCTPVHSCRLSLAKPARLCDITPYNVGWCGADMSG